MAKKLIVSFIHYLSVSMVLTQVTYTSTGRQECDVQGIQDVLIGMDAKLDGLTKAVTMNNGENLPTGNDDDFPNMEVQDCDHRSQVGKPNDINFIQTLLNGGSLNKEKFCRAFFHRIPRDDTYTVSVSILNKLGTQRSGYGHVGIFFNYANEDAFDFIYLRRHSVDPAAASTCLVIGHRVQGAYTFTSQQECPGAPVLDPFWFTMSLQINGKTVQILLNDKLILNWSAHYDSVGKIGVFSQNGYVDSVVFRHFTFND